MVLVLRVAYFFFCILANVRYISYSDKQKKKKKKTGKDIGGANIRHSWFSMAWHPKTEPQENTSAPDLHETATTITVVPKKMITIFVHTECVRVHVSNFMDAAIITYLQVNTPPDTCRTCKTAFSIFYLLKWLLRHKHRQKKNKSIAVQKDKK